MDSICSDSLRLILFKIVEGFPIMSGVDFCAFNISFSCSFPLRFLKAPHNYFKWRALFPLPSLNEVLQLTVVFIAALIAHAQKLVVLCKMQMMDPNDCAPPSPPLVGALLMYSLNCLSSKAGCTDQNISFLSEKNTDPERNWWLEDARQLFLKDE